MREQKNPTVRGRVTTTTCAATGPGVSIGTCAHTTCLTVVQPSFGAVTTRAERRISSRAVPNTRLIPLSYGTCCPREAQSNGRIVGRLTRLDQAAVDQFAFATTGQPDQAAYEDAYQTLQPF
jgi:hypothetical protein